MMRVIFAAILLVLPASTAFAEGEWIADKRTGCRVWNPFDLTGVDNADKVANWSGPCVGGIANGRGVLQWFTFGFDEVALRYEGIFRNGRLNGWGVYTETGGDRYEGNWLNGKKHGRGVIIQADGTRAEGNFSNNELNGRGVVIFYSGARYEGYFRNGKFHGQGVFTVSDTLRYVGNWADGEANGFGTLYSGDRKYSGQWSNKIVAGKGCLVQKPDFCFGGFQ